MNIITTSRDHKSVYSSKQLKCCERFVGVGHYAFEEGIDDQYTMFYFSGGVDDKTMDMIVNNKHRIWHLLDEGLKFESIEDLIQQLNELVKEFEGEDDWEEIQIPQPLVDPCYKLTPGGPQYKY